MIIEQLTREHIKELYEENKLTDYEATSLILQLEILSELKQSNKKEKLSFD